MSEFTNLVIIDGQTGEGGGQILRSALALSIITGRGFHISNIRGRRKKPGLMTQHLAAVDAATEICNAQVEGARINSTDLTFIPSKIRSGRYHFTIKTAGSAALVLQTIFLPLSVANSASSFRITGGTHVPWSPCYHYLQMQWLPYLHQIGFDAVFLLDKAGFYPQGGGQISGTIRPVGKISPISIVKRGKLLKIEGISAVANLKLEIAERQKRQAQQRLLKHIPAGETPHIHIRIEELSSYVKGTVLLLKGEFENSQCCFFSLGEIGKPAERVADEAVDAFLAFLETDGAVDHFLADQLILPLCMAESDSVIHTSQVTPHLLTNSAIVELFQPGTVEVRGDVGKPGMIWIKPKPLSDYGSPDTSPRS